MTAAHENQGDRHMDLEQAVGISAAVPTDANGQRDVSRLVTEIVRAWPPVRASWPA